MELIVKVNVKTIETVDEKTKKKNKFTVYNTYVKDPNTSEWVKCNVKFKQGEEKPVTDSYVYADEKEISINEVGKYPTIFINKVNQIRKLKFNNNNLQQYFKTSVEQAKEEMGIPDEGTIFDAEPVDEKDLPF